jgi:hypothetical protein
MKVHLPKIPLGSRSKGAQADEKGRYVVPEGWSSLFLKPREDSTSYNSYNFALKVKLRS